MRFIKRPRLRLDLPGFISPGLTAAAGDPERSQPRRIVIKNYSIEICHGAGSQPPVVLRLPGLPAALGSDHRLADLVQHQQG
jgi:hypothetical protein